MRPQETKNENERGGVNHPIIFIMGFILALGTLGNEELGVASLNVSQLLFGTVLMILGLFAPKCRQYR